MTVRREARHLSGADIGRTVACYDQISGDSITSEVSGIIHQLGYVAITFDPATTFILEPDQVVAVTGKDSPWPPA